MVLEEFESLIEQINNDTLIKWHNSKRHNRTCTLDPFDQLMEIVNNNSGIVVRAIEDLSCTGS